jgi:uncharacterized protein DUF6644/predicted membrane protein DUF2214
MSLSSIARWLASREWAQDFAASSYFYPIVLGTHLVCIAVFGGMILMTNLRLLGWSLRSESVSDVVTRLRIWKRIGFTVMISCGLLLAGSEADKYYNNPFFWIKMTLLALIGAHGLVFRRSVYRNTAELDRAPSPPRQAKLAASLSLILWIGVVCFGRLIGYYETPLLLLNAALTMQGTP